MNDLTPRNEGGGSLTTTVVADVTNDLHLIARNAEEMKAAQAAMTGWFASKLEIAERDHTDLCEALQVAIKEGFVTAPLKRQVTNARKRAEFYAKCREASAAGYAIVPNMPADIFAIRTNRAFPTRQSSDYRRSSFDERSEGPPLGDGEWKDSETLVRQSSWQETGKDGTAITRHRYYADEFPDEIEFPISVARPQIMSATAEAMALKCFDELAVLPGRRGKGDPLVLGYIRKPGSHLWDNNGRLTFLIAWYVDTRAL